MRPVFTILLLLSFSALSVFGIFEMNHGNGPGHAHEGCLAATAQRTDCPKGENILSFLTFHLDAFRSFSTAVFGENLGGILLLLFSPLFVLGIGIIQGLRLDSPPFQSFAAYQFLELPLQRQLARWLALHENSPSLA